MTQLELLLSATFRMFPPIILAGLGGLLSFRIGMLNIALEGMMLLGAFFAVVVSYLTGSAWFGLLAATLLGGALGFLFALFNLRFNANNIVTGVAVNILSLGLTTYFLRVLFGVRGAFSSPRIVGLPLIRIPILDHIPVLRVLSGQSVLVYVAIGLTFAVHYFLYHTPAGLRVRAVGKHPMAAATAGVDVERLKYFCLVSSGLLSGMGGAHLSLGQLTMFTENMTNGRGFIALAATIFGQNTPIGTFAGSLIFGFADALTLRLQTINLPPHLLQMVPYVLTLLVLLAVALKSRTRAVKASAKASKE
ncbi:MAG: ABC transporter permease [Firmicutes bacterium]|nr:ABC transporter permease [Bacillota bacterium]